MTPEGVMTIARDAMQVALYVAGPVLFVVLGIGLLISIFQAATQINEQTLSFIPKLIGVFIVLLIAGPFMISTLVDYMRMVFTSFPSLTH